MPMTSRSRTGCYTCRIRKKKCDEQYPSCGHCSARDLDCYGFGVPPPEWMQGKRGWAEITSTHEASELRKTAEAKYKASRRVKKASSSSLSETIGIPDRSKPFESDTIAVRNQSPPTPDSIWWDCALYTSLPTHKPLKTDVEMIILYLELIFPIQFAFYPMSNPTDHSWLMSSLCGNEARYYAAMSISYCHMASSLRQYDRRDGAGLSVEVVKRQNIAAKGLQDSINRLNGRKHAPRDVIKIGLQIMETMHQLLSLEIFSMLEGRWELHHQATLDLLDTMHTFPIERSVDAGTDPIPMSPIELALMDYSSPDDQRNLEFHLTCTVWVDVIANAIFGSPSDTLRHFDYIPYLRSNLLKTDQIMGCYSPVMALIADITRLRDWKTIQLRDHMLDTVELLGRFRLLSVHIEAHIRRLEIQSMTGMTKTEVRGHLVSLHFAYAAQVYLHVIVFGSNTAHPDLVSLVNRSLPLMEALENLAVIRINWPLTITGCMAQRELYPRFRALITRIAARKEPMGMVKKGLVVLEECWRLRNSATSFDYECDWRDTAGSLGKRILFI